MEQKSKKAKLAPRPKLVLAKIISQVLGKSENIIMFRKIKGKTYLFILKEKSLNKIDVKEKPKGYALSEFENLGAFLYNLLKEKSKTKK